MVVMVVVVTGLSDSMNGMVITFMGRITKVSQVPYPIYLNPSMRNEDEKFV